MTNEEIRQDLRRIYGGREVVSDTAALIIVCRIIEELLERTDPDVEALIEKQRAE